jgi:hypothetical protein
MRRESIAGESAVARVLTRRGKAEAFAKIASETRLHTAFRVCCGTYTAGANVASSRTFSPVVIRKSLTVRPAAM